MWGLETEIEMELAIVEVQEPVSICKTWRIGIDVAAYWGRNQLL